MTEYCEVNWLEEAVFLREICKSQEEQIAELKEELETLTRRLYLNEGLPKTACRPSEMY